MSPSKTQLALEFEHRPALTGEDFLVAPPNAEAIRWIDAWPGWPGGALVVFGPPGSGKTHLAQVFRSRAGAPAIISSDLIWASPMELVADAPALVLDGAEDAVANGLEKALLHLYNHMRETGRTLMLTATRPPARWGIRLADLASRLKAVAQVGIGTPDDGLIAALLVKQFADRQLRVDNEVVEFMVARMERSFEAARRTVAAIDRMAMREKRNITVPLARRVLGEKLDQGAGEGENVGTDDPKT